MPSSIVQSSWDAGEASRGPSKTKAGSGCGFDIMTSAASAPHNMAILLQFSSWVAVAAKRGAISALPRWRLRYAASSRENNASAPRLLEPRARSASRRACRSRSISARTCPRADIVGRRRSSRALGGGGVSLGSGIGEGGPSWELDDAAWELCFGPGAGPLDGVLLAGAALLVVCQRREPLLAFVAARDPSQGESLDLLRNGAGDPDAEERSIAGAHAGGVAARAAAEADALPEAAAVAAARGAGAAALEGGAAPDVRALAAAAER